VDPFNVVRRRGGGKGGAEVRKVWWGQRTADRGLEV
jgi:hypothetical protein